MDGYSLGRFSSIVFENDFIQAATLFFVYFPKPATTFCNAFLYRFPYITGAILAPFSMLDNMLDETAIQAKISPTISYVIFFYIAENREHS